MCRILQTDSLPMVQTWLNSASRSGMLPWQPQTMVDTLVYNQMSLHGIGLTSDDVTKLSNTWQRGKLVLNKVSAPYKSMLGEKSLTWRSALFLRGEVRTVFTTTSQLSASHFKRFWGSDKCGAVFRSIDDLPACFCVGRYLCLEPILPVATLVAGLWRSTCKPYTGLVQMGPWSMHSHNVIDTLNANQQLLAATDAQILVASQSNCPWKFEQLGGIRSLRRQRTKGEKCVTCTCYKEVTSSQEKRRQLKC